MNRKTVEHMQEYAEQMEQAAGYLDRQTDKLWNACVKDSDIGYQIALETISGRGQGIASLPDSSGDRSSGQEERRILSQFM